MGTRGSSSLHACMGFTGQNPSICCHCQQVQGVNFRSGTVDEGEKLGVVGHVENTSSGAVTGEVQGKSGPVSQMKVSC